MALRKWKSGWDWGAGVYLVDDNNNIIEELAQTADMGIALGAYKAAKEGRSWSIIQLRERSRVVWTAKTGGYDSATRTIELLWER